MANSVCCVHNWGVKFEIRSLTNYLGISDEKNENKPFWESPDHEWIRPQSSDRVPLVSYLEVHTLVSHVLVVQVTPHRPAVNCKYFRDTVLGKLCSPTA